MESYNLTNEECDNIKRISSMDRVVEAISDANRIGAVSNLVKSDGLTHLEIYNQTLELVKLAKKCDGQVFGGYVRDFIVPYKHHNIPLENLDFKDMDFWFKRQADANDFISNLNVRGKALITPETTKQNYPIGRTNFLTVFKDKPFVLIDIVVSDVYPVCDFSVNLLSWDSVSFQTHNPYNPYNVINMLYNEKDVIPDRLIYSVKDIINQIKTHEYDVCKSFKDLALNGGYDPYAKLAGVRLLSFGPKLFYRRQKWYNDAEFHIPSFYKENVKEYLPTVDKVKAYLDELNLSKSEKQQIVLHLIKSINNFFG